MGTEVQILSQLHDAVYFQFRERGEKEEMDLLERAVDCIQVPQKHGNRTMVIPGETVGGFNWAHRFRLREDGSLDDWNPRGLDKIKI
jgi:hypothetical protein